MKGTWGEETDWVLTLTSAEHSFFLLIDRSQLPSQLQDEEEVKVVPNLLCNRAEDRGLSCVHNTKKLAQANFDRRIIASLPKLLS